MTLTDALAAALHTATCIDVPKHQDISTKSDRRTAASILSDPTFREAVTAALADAMFGTAHDDVSDPEWTAYAEFIVARLLPDAVTGAVNPPETAHPEHE